MFPPHISQEGETIHIKGFLKWLCLGQTINKGAILMKKLLLIALLAIAWAPLSQADDTYLGKLSANPYGADSTSNAYGAHGSEYSSDSINNAYGEYGSEYSNKSATNPYATDAPKLYDSDGNYRGRLSTNPYDADSTSNPYGRYGSEYSSDSINNPYGAGSPYKADSPNNPYGEGMSIYGDDDGWLSAGLAWCLLSGGWLNWSSATEITYKNQRKTPLVNHSDLMQIRWMKPPIDICI